MGQGCRERTLGMAAAFKDAAALTGAHFMDAAECEFNPVDHMHLSRKGHSQLAHMLAELVPTLV